MSRTLRRPSAIPAWLALTLVGASACNAILGNSGGEVLTAPADGGTSGAIADGGSTPKTDGGPPPAGDAAADAATPNACPCGDIDGYCSACAPTAVTSGPPSILSLAVTPEILAYVTDTPRQSGRWPFASDGALGVATSDATPQAHTVASAVPSLGEPIGDQFFRLDGNRQLQQCSSDHCLPPGRLGVRLLAAADGVVVTGLSLSYATVNGTHDLFAGNPDASDPGGLALVAVNDSTVFFAAGAPDDATDLQLLSQPYAPVIEEAASPRGVAGVKNAVAMAASNERVFFAPCKDASICSISTIASTTDPEQTLLSETVPKRIFVDGAVLYFSDTEKTYRCNFAACTPERIGSGPLLAFARSSTEVFLSFADQLVRVPRTPLRSF